MSVDTDEVRRLLSASAPTGQETVLDPRFIADRAHRSRRRRTAGAGASMTVLAVAAAVGLGSPDALRLGETEPMPATAGALDVRKDLTNSPPKEAIGAGRYAVSAVFTISRQPLDNGDELLQRRWSVLDPDSQTYEPTDWSWVDVAPGLDRAAVLDGELPSRRLGILDTRSRDVEWFDLERPAAALTWSPDGSRILATTYSSSPDVVPASGVLAESPRTGFQLIDPETGESRFQPLPGLAGAPEEAGPSNINRRQDFGWSLDGSTIWGPTDTVPDRLFYELDGTPAQGDPDEYIPYTSLASASPDGELVIGRQSGLPTSVLDGRTGRLVGEQEALQLLAWADDDHLIALGGCARPCEGSAEFRNGLVLVAADGSSSTPLSRPREGDGAGRWQWVLTRR